MRVMRGLTMTKILMLTGNSSLQDGINRQILAIAPALNRLQGFKIAVCTIFPAGELNVELEKCGVTSYALGLPHGHSWKTWLRFHQVMKEFQPDVIHGHVIGLLQRFYLQMLARRIPLVMTCHGITDVESGVRHRNWRDSLEGFIGKLIKLNIVRTIYISHGVRDLKGVKGGEVVYNPIKFECALKETHFPGRLRELLGVSRDVQVIGTACRIAPPKKPIIFVSVMCSVLKTLSGVHAIVCGSSNDNRLMTQLKEIVVQAGVEDRFHWLGYRPDAPALTRELDCFVMTSQTEGLPTALLEAISVLTPIAFMRGLGGLIDLDEFNTHEGPIAAVADMDDTEGLSRQIVCLLRNKALAQANARRALEVGRRHFDVNRIVLKLAEIYRDIAR